MAEVKFAGSRLCRHFESLVDPRETRNRLHLLTDVVVIAVCAVMVGCEGPTAISRWARAKRTWLAQFLELPHGLPSRDCIRRVLSALKPQAFQKCFEEMLASCLTAEEPGALRLIAIDGKTNRRSHQREKGLGALHIVSAWATEHGLALGQVATDAKSNEITAIPELLEQLDLRGALVSIDAMGCQKDIAEKIIDGGGDFLLAAKDNQPKLSAAIRAFFERLLEHDLAGVPHRAHETCDQGHGRVDERRYYMAQLPADFPQRSEWTGLQAIGCAIRITTLPDGQQTSDVRYYISSCYLSGPRFADAVRKHWGIENSLHWVLDMNFREDESRTRERTLGNNLSWLRRFAISKLKQHPAQDSLKGKLQTAGWNDDFLAQVLTGSYT